jgi:two-component system sensor histidine kinase DesK
MAMHLIPTERDYGWTPYVWLVYMVPFLATPFLYGATLLRTLLTLVAGAAFVALYFRAYWLHGRALLAAIAAMTLMGVVFLPINIGAGALFIYAGSFAGRMKETRRGVWIVAGVVAVLLIEAKVADLPLFRWWWGALFTLIIGGVNLHYGQVHRQNARLRLAQDEIERLAKVAERERIARDLHDLLGHTLSLIILKSELASKIVDPVRAREEMKDVERISREALAEVRSAVSGYRSGGLQNELTTAKEALETAGVKVECSVDALPFAPAQEVVLALAVREAVTNVIRHAQARHCSIHVTSEGNACRLTIRDDGRGGAVADGFGLTGMRERVDSLGGTLTRDRSHGTTLTIELPFAGAAPHVVERGA